MQWTLRVLLLTLGVAVASAVLASAGGAAKPKGSDSVTCSLSAGTTFTWAAGTTLIGYEFDRADNTPTAIGTITVRGNKGGSTTTITTPTDAAQVQATFYIKSIGARKPPVACTA